MSIMGSRDRVSASIGFGGSGDCPTTLLISAQPRNRSGAARLALPQTAVAIVCHMRRVAQNQPEQMFETRPHGIEDPVRSGSHRAIVKQPDGFASHLRRPGSMTGMATAVYASAKRAAPRQLPGGTKLNT